MVRRRPVLSGVRQKLISEAQWEYLASFKDSPDKQKLLPQPVQLPAGMDEWIFDAYQAVYPDCQGVQIGRASCRERV